jgi:hypothetical protein
MPHTRYIVVQHKDEWLIKFGVGDKEYGPYHSQAEAMLFAIDAAQKLGEQGENTQVGLIGEHAGNVDLAASCIGNAAIAAH